LRKRLEEEAKSGNVVFNVIRPSVSLQAMIMMDVQVVEVRRNDLTRLGVQWNAFTNGPHALLIKGREFNLFPPEGPASGFGISSAFQSVLNTLISEGVIRVLAQPKLVSKSGTRAEFLAGGEVPIPIILDDKISVEFKQVGVILNIEPVADPDGFIATKVDVEVSAIDRSVTVLGIPGFTVNKTKMELNVQSGQTMVISGMLKADDAKTIEKVPGLGQIPVLGELFKSRDFEKGTTELVIFVTPYLVNPDSPWNQDMLQYTQDLAGQAKQDVETWSLWD
jgi:pilus assembly protein CpaC